MCEEPGIDRLAMGARTLYPRLSQATGGCSSQGRVLGCNVCWRQPHPQGSPLPWAWPWGTAASLAEQETTAPCWSPAALGSGRLLSDQVTEGVIAGQQEQGWEDPEGLSQ